MRLRDDVVARLQRLAESRGEAPATVARELIEQGVRAPGVAEIAVAYDPSMQPRAVNGHLLTALIPGLAAACARWKVKRLTLFGSFANGDARPDSDVDLCVDFFPRTDELEFEAYLGLERDLEAIFRRKVDLISRSGTKNPYVRRSIESTEIVIYDAS